jgi:parallel beta-helix repeat protein
VHIVSSLLEGGTKGIFMSVGADVEIEHVTLKGMAEGGVDANVRSRVEISDCIIEDVAVYGIQTAKQAVASIRNNQISRARFGLLLNGDFPPLEGNTIKDCEVGIALTQTSAASILRNNKLTKNKVGIGCHQFCSPIIEKNIFVDCDKGIDCFQGSSPLVRQNRFARNQVGIFCVQMCNPVVTLNEFSENEVAAYLHLSSYAQFHKNNFVGNLVHIELDNMSYDWELRASKKPKRNRQIQNESLVKQGRTAPQEIQVEVESEGFVDAVGNYWGPETLSEMEEKGPESNITGIKDGFDVPILTYEGWPGEYKKDRVRYSGWLKERILNAGPDNQ